VASRYHTVDGVRVFCSATGQGDPVLLLHGLLMSHRAWDAVLDGLGRRLTVFAPDLPGFGESDRPEHYSYSIDAMACTVAGLMDQLGISRAALVGHSLGGAVALTLAGVNPERISRVAAVAPTIYPAPLPIEARVALLPVVGETLFCRGLSRRGLRRFLRRHVYVDPQLPSDEMLQHYWERLVRPGGRRAVWRTIQTLANLEQTVRVPRRVSCPTLLVWGEEDAMVPVESGRRLEAEIERARLLTLRGAGHCPMEEQAAAFCEAMLPFLCGGER
jgi:pimeloyl-ACP methyl ester carboxylesterase